MSQTNDSDRPDYVIGPRGSTYYDRDARDPDPAYVDDGLEEILRLYSSERRRILIQVLDDYRRTHADGEAGNVTIEIDNLAQRVATIEDNVETALVNKRSVKSAKVSLRHTHLPLLADHSVISWNREERTVTIHERVHAISTLLSTLSDVVEESPVATEVRTW